ncbi:MAG TPA: preprotein translocase subunit YajC [Candidatus Omnitrophota bacterium]|nr:preprotein translocase subunit YajC [Candidatus Omnitrophota bacterium]HQL41001.1 preprotein translocase subunit YajC [Candidatus Omnitrophota bacterium]
MGPEASINPIIALFPYLLIFGIFYFLVIKPQKEQQKKFQKMLEELKKNDTIVTSGGIHGTIVNIKEKTVTIRVDDNVKLEIDRTAVARVEKANLAS